MTESRLVYLHWQMEVVRLGRSFSNIKQDLILAALHATLAVARRVIRISNVMALAEFHEFTLPRSETAGDFCLSTNTA